MSEVSQPETHQMPLPSEGGGSRKRLRKNVQIMFIGLTPEESTPITALLRASRLSPKGKHIESEEDFLSALSENSWDLILCTRNRGTFSIKQAQGHLKRQNKDIPTIQLVTELDCTLILEGLRSHLQAVVPLEEKELLLFHIRRELDNLEHRRRLQRVESALAETQQRNIELMASSRNPICCCRDDHILYINQAFLDNFGYENREQLIGSAFSDLFVLEEQEEVIQRLQQISNDETGEIELELTALRRDLTEFTAPMILCPARYASDECVRVFFHEDSDNGEHLLSEELDLVSGLYNKKFLSRQLEQMTQKALKGGHDCNLLYIVLDQYESHMQMLGMEACDHLIRGCTSVLRRNVSTPHFISRPSEDVFAIIYLDPNIEKAEKLADTLNQELVSYLAENIKGQHTPKCCIGIAPINDNTPPQEELLARAAMTARSLLGKGGHSVYTPKQDTPAQQRVLERLEKSIQEDQLRLLFQPIVNLTDQSAEDRRYEVLMRLLGDNEKEISPDVFMTAIYDPAISIKLDRWVIEKSLSMLVPTLDNKEKNYLFLSLSLPTLCHKGTLTWLAEVLRRNDIPADRLIFQISDRDVVRAPKKVHLFSKELHKMHCGVCIKHFAVSDHSSATLKQVQADYVKLDGSIIAQLSNDSQGDEAFYNLAQQLKSLNKTIIAPQLEDTRVMSKLWKAGVNYVQGYYLQKPRHEMEYDFFEGY